MNAAVLFPAQIHQTPLVQTTIIILDRTQFILYLYEKGVIVKID